MRGRPEDSLVYCSKQDSAPFVYGTLPAPGKRTDLHAATDRIRDGATLRELAQDAEIGSVAIVKFHKGLTILRSLLQGERTDKPFVVWLSGPTGTGKTRSLFELGELVAPSRDDIWISAGGLRWFDGYDGQSVAIFDDFRAKHVTSFAILLRLLDRYPYRVEFKGGFVNWVPKFIFISCPYGPERCFAKRKEFVPEDIEQLLRRLDFVHEFSSVQSDAERDEFCRRVVGLIGEANGLPGGLDDSVPDGTVHGSDVPGVPVRELSRSLSRLSISSEPSDAEPGVGLGQLPGTSRVGVDSPGVPYVCDADIDGLEAGIAGFPGLVRPIVVIDLISESDSDSDLMRFASDEDEEMESVDSDELSIESWLKK